MSETLFYACSRLDNRLLLDAEEAHHCLHVLRHKPGDALTVTNGQGSLFAARLVGSDSQGCLAEIADLLQEEAPPEPFIHLAVAPTKSPDRYEYLLEKGTEIGVSAFTPLLCRHSLRKNIPQKRIKKILISAMKQSGRLWLPRFYEPCPFEAFIARAASGQRFIAHCRQHNLPAMISLYAGRGPCTVLIGPEGDFSPAEVEQAEKAGWVSVSLGQKRLRTETAGLVASLSVLLKYELVQSSV